MIRVVQSLFAVFSVDIHFYILGTESPKEALRSCIYLPEGKMISKRSYYYPKRGSSNFLLAQMMPFYKITNVVLVATRVTNTVNKGNYFFKKKS